MPPVAFVSATAEEAAVEEASGAAGDEVTCAVGLLHRVSPTAAASGAVPSSGADPVGIVVTTEAIKIQPKMW